MQTDKALWQTINAYDIDAADVALPFSRRLARDNGWTEDFAHRAIAEYKRFMYLICVSGRTLTPSEEIDSVWHLHLVYTRDYWDRFCGETLGRPVHHGPTEGGNAEAEKYRDCYRETLDLYRAEFCATPSPDLWPDAQKRFAQRPLQLVDRRKHFTIPKREAYLCATGAAVLVLAACAPTKLVKDGIQAGFAVFILCVLGIFVASMVSGAKRRTKGNGSVCGSGFGCGTSGSDSGDSGSGDGGSGCGGGCGGGD